MADFSRRGFVVGAGVIGAAVASGASAQESDAASAGNPTADVESAEMAAQTRFGGDLAVINARIHTIDARMPRAQALLILGDRFAAVGDNALIGGLIGPTTQVIDAQGMTVTPGFVDSHCHPDGLEQVSGVDVGYRSIAEIVEAMRGKASATAPEHWVVGFMYDDTKLTDGRALSRMDLDAAVPDHPAMVRHRGGHTGVYNTRAFDLAGVTAQTPDPEGGKYYRQDGQLTGRVAERAQDVFATVGKRADMTPALMREGIKRITEKMSRLGLTSVTNAYGDQSTFDACRDALAAGELGVRMCFMPDGESSLYRGLMETGVRTGFGNEWLRIGAAKFSADGSASERTMAMSTPYIGRPDDYGILTMTAEEIDAAVEKAHRAGFQVGVHANGDVAIAMVLDAYERMQRDFPRADARHRIEHCSLVNPDLLRRIKAVGAIPTPFHTYAHYHGNKWVEYGPEKMQWMFAHRSFLDYDIPVAPASDYPPGPFEPLMALQSMVTRKDFQGRVWGPNQRIRADEALRVCTMNGAYVSFEEDLKGSISPGKLADFVILADDPLTADPDSLKDITVVRTVLGGKTVHEA